LPSEISFAMSSAADRNLLFGVLAIELDFVSRDQLIAAMSAWVLEKQTPLDEILARQGALSAEHRALLEALVAAHLKKHGDDPQQSLAAVSSIESLRDQLRQIADPEIEASLAHVSQTVSHADFRAQPRADSFATRSVGESTSDGVRFRILRPHAKGGLGEVFVAEDAELGREVALKQIQPHRADDPNSRSRFVLEAEITGGLEHPGIVPVYGLGTYANGRPFYAMRFIRGDSLKDAIQRFHNCNGPRHFERPAHRVSSRGTCAVPSIFRSGRELCNYFYSDERGVIAVAGRRSADDPVDC
jgi:serine/threonine protein kinase